MAFSDEEEDEDEDDSVELVAELLTDIALLESAECIVCHGVLAKTDAAGVAKIAAVSKKERVFFIREKEGRSSQILSVLLHNGNTLTGSPYCTGVCFIG